MRSAANSSGAHDHRAAPRRARARTDVLVVLRPVAFWALWPCVVGYALLFSPLSLAEHLDAPPPHACSPGGQPAHALPPGPLVVALLFPVAGGTLEVVTALRLRRQGERSRAWASGVSGVGLNLLNLVLLSLFLVSILGLTKTKDLTLQNRAGSQSRTAAEQAILYGAERGAYPASLRALRDERYAAIPDRDPWGRRYELAPALTSGAPPTGGEEVFVYSRGVCGIGRYVPGLGGAGRLGAIGYSSLYGPFTGEEG